MKINYYYKLIKKIFIKINGFCHVINKRCKCDFVLWVDQANAKYSC